MASYPSKNSCWLNPCPAFRIGGPFGVVLEEISVDTGVQTRGVYEEVAAAAAAAAGSQHEGLRGGCMLSGRWFAGDVFPGEVGDVLRGSSFDLKYKDNAEDILGAV
jgi:hypothetical protein